jgi:hypothetical protein
MHSSMHAQVMVNVGYDPDPRDIYFPMIFRVAGPDFENHYVYPEKSSMLGRARKRNFDAQKHSASMEYLGKCF